MTLKKVAAYTLEWSKAAKMMPMTHWTAYAARKKTSVCRRLAQNNGALKARM
jgi:hypothetical protein